MNFHGHIHPGVVSDQKQVLQLVIHAPKRAAGVTIKIWEMDTFKRADGSTEKEGSADDLLAQFEGAIEPGEETQADPSWRKFVVASHHIEDAEPDLLCCRLQFGGDDTVYDIPIRSEKDEAEGRAFEIGFSIEVGGSEKFKTTSPVLFDIPRIMIRGELRSFHLTEDGEPDPVTERFSHLALHWAAIGTRIGEGLTATLDVAGVGYFDSTGLLLTGDPNRGKEGEPAPRPLLVRRDRALLAYLLDQPSDLRGPSSIPAGTCLPVTEEGRVVVERSAGFGLQAWIGSGEAAAIMKGGDHSGDFVGDGLEVDATDLGSFEGPAAFADLDFD